MPKRFTDTEKWKRPWFRQLTTAYKLLWIYICDECDIAGVWYVDLELASFLIGEKFDVLEAQGFFSKQIIPLGDGTRWQIRDFTPFQYGQLVPNNNLHKAVLRRLDALADRSISAPHQPLTRGMSGDKDKDKDMYKEGVKDVKASEVFNFEVVWTKYPRKLGRKDAERHFKASVKTPQDYLDLQNALDCFVREMRREGRPDDKIPYGSTWFNSWRDWVSYGGVQMPKPPPPKPRPPEPPAPELTEADLLEMHNQMVKTLGPCREAGCRFCKKDAEVKQETEPIPRG